MEPIPCEFCNALISPRLYYSHILLCIQEYDEQDQDEVRVIPKLPNAIPILEKTECPICFDNIKGKCYELKCGHVFCCSCIENWSKKQSTCPICKRPI